MYVCTEWFQSSRSQVAGVVIVVIYGTTRTIMALPMTAHRFSHCSSAPPANRRRVALAANFSDIKPFKLERFFAKYEFNTQHLLCTSDAEALTVRQLLEFGADVGDVESKMLWENMKFGYTESQGLPQLREQIASLYGSYVNMDDILVATPQECILLAISAVVEPESTVICTFPGYQSLIEIAESKRCNILKWEPRIDPDTLSIQFSVEDLRSLLDSHNASTLIVNFPHNPTGCLPSKAEWDEIIELCQHHGVTMFSDEMYRGLELGNVSELRLDSAVDRSESAIVLAGLSKVYGLPGLRIGWIATRNARALERMKELRDYTTICCAAPSEILALMALRAHDPILSHIRDIVLPNAQLADEFFGNRHWKRFRWYHPVAGTIAFPSLSSGEDAMRFSMALLEKASILTLPASEYSFPLVSHFRVGFGRKDFGTVLEVLDDYLQSTPQTL